MVSPKKKKKKEISFAIISRGYFYDYEETRNITVPLTSWLNSEGVGLQVDFSGKRMWPVPAAAVERRRRTHGALASFPSFISISLSSFLHGDRLSSLVDLFG